MAIPTFIFALTLSLGSLQPKSAMDRGDAPHLLGLLASAAVRNHVFRLV